LERFTQGDDIILAAVRLADVPDPVKWDVSRGGAEFPHIYGVLPISAVERYWDLSPDSEGRYAAKTI